MSQHTPEPWESDDDGCIRTSDGYLVATVAPHGNVNTIARTGETFSRADAALITAAPDFLAVCKTTVRALRFHLIVASPWGAHLVEQIEALITKAENGGRSE